MEKYDSRFVCGECGSTQLGKNPFNDAFIQGGQGGGANAPISPCKYCGGVVVYVENVENIERVINSIRKTKGLGPR